MNLFLKIILGVVIIYFLVKISDYKNLKKKLSPKKKQSSNIMEEECRAIFEDIFGVEFNTIRPEWLKNPETGRNLELDGYNPNIKTSIGQGVAFEYNGSQHSFYNPHFHRSQDAFVKQVRRDQYKRKVCADKKIVLISIPYHITKDGLSTFIRTELKKYKPYEHLNRSSSTQSD